MRASTKGRWDFRHPPRGGEKKSQRQLDIIKLYKINTKNTEGGSEYLIYRKRGGY